MCLVLWSWIFWRWVWFWENRHYLVPRPGNKIKWSNISHLAKNKVISGSRFQGGILTCFADCLLKVWWLLGYTNSNMLVKITSFCYSCSPQFSHFFSWVLEKEDNLSLSPFCILHLKWAEKLLFYMVNPTPQSFYVRSGKVRRKQTGVTLARNRQSSLCIWVRKANSGVPVS